MKTELSSMDRIVLLILTGSVQAAAPWIGLSFEMSSEGVRLVIHSKTASSSVYFYVYKIIQENLDMRTSNYNHIASSGLSKSQLSIHYLYLILLCFIS